MVAAIRIVSVDDVTKFVISSVADKRSQITLSDGRTKHAILDREQIKELVRAILQTEGGRSKVTLPKTWTVLEPGRDAVVDVSDILSKAFE